MTVAPAPKLSLGSAEDFFEQYQSSAGNPATPAAGLNLGSSEGFYENFLKQQEAAAPEDDRWEITKGFAAGADQFQAMTGAFAAMLGDKLDSETITEWGQDVLKSNLEEASQSPASVEGVENIGGIGDALDFAAYQIGNAVPSMGSAITGGLAGGFAGSLVAPGPGTLAGGVAGAFTPSYILSAGETYIDMIEAGVDKSRAVNAAFLTGIPMALLDVIEPTKVAGKILWKPVKKETARSLGKRLAQDIPKGMATEGLTEGAQEAVKGAAVAHMSDQDFLTSENLSQILNAMAAGGIVGGVTGGVTGSIPDRKAPDDAPQGKPGVAAPAADQGARVAEEQAASVVEEALSDPDEVPTVTTPGFTSTQVSGVPFGPRPGAAKAKVRRMWPDDMSAIEEYDPYQERADLIDAIRPPDSFTASEVSGTPLGPRRGPVRADSKRIPTRFAASGAAPAPQNVTSTASPASTAQVPNNPVLKFINDVQAYIDAGGDPDPVNVSKSLRIPIPAANAALQILNNRPATAPYVSSIDPTDEDIPFDPVMPPALQDAAQARTDSTAAIGDGFPKGYPHDAGKAGESSGGPQTLPPVKNVPLAQMPAEGPVIGVTDSTSDARGLVGTETEGPESKAKTRAKDLSPAETQENQIVPELTVDAADPVSRDRQIARDTVADPTPAQAEAGNYRMGHIKVAGLDVSIETPKGGMRRGYDEEGNIKWENKSPADYGYIKRTEGADGDQVDVYVTSDPGESPKVFIVDQNFEGGGFDEHKVIVGARDESDAASLYEAGFDSNLGEKLNGGVSEVSLSEFKTWLKAADSTKVSYKDWSGKNNEEAPASVKTDATTQTSRGKGKKKPAKKVNATAEDDGDLASRDDGETNPVDASGRTPESATRKESRFDEPSFVQIVDKALAGELRPRQQLVLGRTPDILKYVGLPDRLLSMPQSVLRKVTGGKRDIDVSIIKRLPLLLSDPLAVFRSDTKPDSIVVLVAARDADMSPLIVSIDAAKGTVAINTITSVYGKDREGWFSEQSEKGNLLYIHKERSARWFRGSGVQFPGTDQSRRSENKILTEEDIVKKSRRSASEATGALNTVAVKRIADLVRSLVGDRVKVKASADGLTATIDGKRRPIAGRYMNRLIEVSMNFGNPEVTVRHEVIHALKEMGVFTDQEWAVLERQARRVWSAKYGVDRTYADLSKAERTEEAIAQAFGEHRKGGKSPPGFRRIWEKATAFLTRLSNLLRGMGFQAWQDVFARVESGRAGRRPENFNAAVRDNPRHMVGYHGSPHDHDGFSTDHIGSGEGAQAFGWGLYFAGKREVAEYYKSSVPFGSLKLSFLKELDPSSDAEEVIDLIDSGVFSPYQQRVLRALEADDWLGFDYPSQAISAAYSGKLDNWDASPELKDAVNSSGKLYTVDIPEDGDYLDWDAVLSDQSPSVREKLRDAFSGDSGALEMVRKDTPSDSESLTGREIYKSLSRSLAAPIDEGGMNAWTSVQPVENDKAASEFLLSLGIPGIKYLDGMSRSMTGEGSRNYVIFDDSSVRILAKESRFGEPPDQDSGPKSVDDIGESIAAEAKSAGIERPGVLRSVSKFMSDWKKAPALPRKPDLNWFSKALVHPRTIAQMYPAFTKVWQAATGQFERRDVVNAELSRLWESYTRLSEKDKAQVNKVMEIGRIEGEVYGGKTITAKNISGAAQLTERGETVTLNEEQTKGYKAARLSMNRALEFFREEVLREWGYGEPGDPATYDEIMEHVKDLRADAKKAGPDGPEMMKEAGTAARLAEIIKEIEDAKRTGYVPFSRYGEYGIVVKDSLGTVVHFEKIEAGGMIGRQIARKKVHDIHEGLKSKYPTSEGFVVSDPRQIVTEKDVQGLGVKLSDLDGLASLVNLEGPEWESVREDLSDGMKKLGFRKHFINARNTAGYSTDFERSIADYITGISSYLARRRYADEFESALANIPIAQSGLRAYAKKYSEYIQSPQEEFQRLRNLGFFYYLSGNISSALVNLSQVPLATMPYLTQFASASAVTLETNRAYKDLAKMMKMSRDGGTIEFFDPNKAPADVRDDLKKAWDEGILVPLTTLEQMGMAHNRGKHLKGLSKQSRTVVEFAGSMFTGAERANRIATFIVAHRLARKQGFSERASKIMKSNALWRAEGAGSNPAAFATWTIDETHFRMGKVNRPTLFRGAGAAIFQFKGFTVNFMEMLYKMAVMQGPEGKRAMAYVAGGLVMSAGVFGLPFADDLKELVEALYKGLTDEELDIEKEIRDISYEMSGSPLVGEMVTRGPLRMTGADLSRRLGMGSILPTDTIVALFGGDSNKAGEAFGIPLDLTIGKATRAWNYAKLDQPGMAAAELLPTFIKNPIHATAWGSYGVRSTSSGRMQTRPDEVDGLEVMLKAIGFTPTTITREREAEWAKTRVGRAVTDLQARYNTRLARAIVEGDRDEVLIIRDEIEEHNSENPLHRRIIISPSTMKARIRQEVLGSASRHHPRKARPEALRIDEIYPAKEAG